MPTMDERLAVIETKLDYLAGLVIDHINYHKGIPERVAVIEQRLADERHTQDARFQKAMVWLAGALAAVGSLLVGAAVHFLHL